MPEPPPLEEVARLAGMVALNRAIEARKIRRPYEWYKPSEKQLAFHKAPHTVRALYVGNGFGKTRAMGEEFNAWARHLGAWQKTPAWPLLMLLFCKLEKQFELIRTDLQDECFGTEVEWKESDKEFHWPDGSRLFLGLADRTSDWKKWQGVPVDLVGFDEQPPKQLWREMGQRRRAKRKTRFMFAATATEGDSWMYDEIMAPWLKHHADQGMDELRGAIAQTHPYYWVMASGGIHDNPAADAEDVEWYESRTWSSPKERKVRLYGGFERWVGDCLFDDAGLDRLRELADDWDEDRGGGTLGGFTVPWKHARLVLGPEFNAPAPHEPEEVA